MWIRRNSYIALSLQLVPNCISFRVPVYSIVDVYDIIEYLEEDEKNAENVTRIKNYLAVNGAKV